MKLLIYIVSQVIDQEGHNLLFIRSTFAKAQSSVKNFIKETIDSWPEENYTHEVTLVSDGVWSVRITDKNSKELIEEFNMAIEEFEVD